MDFISLVVLLSFVAFIIILKKSRRRTPTNLPPGPRGWEALRCFLSALRRGELHTQAETWSRRYGELVLCRNVLADICFLNSARLVREVYASKEHEDFTNNRPTTFTGWFAVYDFRDLIVSSSRQRPEWPKLRKLLHHAIKFYGDGVEQTESTIQTELQRLVTDLETSNGEDVDVDSTFSNSLLCVLAVLITGECPKPDSRLIKAMRGWDTQSSEMFNPVTDLTLTAFPWLRFVPMLPYRSMCAELIRVRDDLTLQTFTAAKKTHVSGQPRGIIDVLLDDQTKEENQWLCDDNIRALSLNLTAAAYLTSVQTLKAAFLYMTHEPEVIRRVQKEIDENIGARLPRIEDRSNLPYTEAVVLETLRLSSFLPLGLPHETSDDVSVDGYVIPKGSMLFANTWTFHRDPEVFPDPDCFRPDRFLDDAGQLMPATHPLRQSLVSFGIGKRSCVGESFARSRVFLYITTLLQKFDILPPANHELPPATQASWKNGIVLELQPYHLVFCPRS